MPDDVSRDSLASALQALGWKLLPHLSSSKGGFSAVTRLREGSDVAVSFSSPPLVDCLDRDRVGIALVNDHGKVVDCWGLAEETPLFHRDEAVEEPRLTGLLQAAYRGMTGSIIVDNYRFIAGPMQMGDEAWVVLLVLDAREEAEAKRRAQMSERKADALKKIGKALTMHQTLQPMAVAASHAIASAAELAAVLLWVRTAEEGPMELVASVGANRSGTAALAKIDTERGISCAAELAAGRNKPLILGNVKDNPVTEELEAKFCYLAPGGLMVWPLTIGSRLVGLLEVVGREDDSGFLESQDLFATVAEHLSLALNSALMFESVEKLAAFDPLTGIANHRTMQDFLYRRISEAQRSNGSIGVIMLDVDHFRVFNEEEGHDAGDKVLKMVTDVLRACVRPYDLAARYGGEEFTVIMPGVSEETTMTVAERIRKGIEKIEYASSSGIHRHVTASLGCALFPENASDSASILKAADVALYEAKRTSRNKTVMYSGEYQDDRSTDKKLILSAVRDLVPESASEETESFLKSSRPYISHVAAELGLCVSQVQTLEAAALFVLHWVRLRAKNDLVGLHEVGKRPELQSVVASLDELEERFDGEGPKGVKGTSIPLLTRILTVLRTVVAGEIDSLEDDSGRFDPEIVALFCEIDRAA